MLLIFRKCQLCIVLTMFLMFCQVSGFCFYKIGHYKTLFLKTFNLVVSLNCDKLQVISAETYTFYKLIFRIMYFTDRNIFEVSFP